MNTDNRISSNLYEYCNSSPVAHTDPDGKAAVSIAVGLLSLVGSTGLGVIGSISSKRKLEVESPKNKIYDINPLSIAAALIGIAVITTTHSAKIKTISQARKGNGAIYTVYYLAPTKESPIEYVGRVMTANYNQRMRYHKAVRDMVPVDSVSGLTYEQARGMEEIGMQYYHTLRGKFPNNIIHGISPYNPNKEMYIFDTIGYLKNKAENELLNFIDGGI